MKLYITADAIGTPTGGGAVTYHESKALADMDQSVGVAILSRTSDRFPNDPFEQDALFLGWLKENAKPIVESGGITHAHCYSGCLTETVKFLKEKGTRVSYTIAAHHIADSVQAFADLGMDYPYKHLTDPELWKRYAGGYMAADLVIVPSTHSRDVVKSYGYKGTIRVIPHGCEPPEKPTTPPARFMVGYLGAYGPDKGVRWLLEAWKKLNYPVEEAQLVLAGRDSVSPFVDEMIRQYFGFGGGTRGASIMQVGWVKDVADFYNSISLYVQPSTTEGFGIEVLEALAHGRPVICSTGAGASDLLKDGGGWLFPARNPHFLAHTINEFRPGGAYYSHAAKGCRAIAEQYTWDKVRAEYQEVWRRVA